MLSNYERRVLEEMEAEFAAPEPRRRCRTHLSLSWVLVTVLAAGALVTGALAVAGAGTPAGAVGAATAFVAISAGLTALVDHWRKKRALRRRLAP